MEFYGKRTNLSVDYMIKDYMIIKYLYDEETTWKNYYEVRGMTGDYMMLTTQRADYVF